ncbi:MAG: TSUP family transporter [Thermodesulfobacteriota bacterium]
MLSLIEFLIFVAVGSGIGFLGGLFGLGGGFLLIPVLIFSYEHSGLSQAILTHLAIGTSLFVIIFPSLISVYQQEKQNNIDWRAVFPIGFLSSLVLKE